MNNTDIEETNNVALPVAARVAVPIGPRGVQITDLDGLWRFALCVARSGLAPKGLSTPEACATAIQMGLELGLSPMSALQNIAVINGRPGVFGDAALALVRNSGLCLDFDEYFQQGSQRLESSPQRWTDDTAAVCVSRRHGQRHPRVTRFSVADAKLAKLWDKKNRDGSDSPWTSYPARMMMFRARGFNLRDNFGDVLKGFKTVEELSDYPDVAASAPAAKPAPRRGWRGVDAVAESTRTPERPAPTPPPAPEQPQPRPPEPTPEINAAADDLLPPTGATAEEQSGLDQDELCLDDFLSDCEERIAGATSDADLQAVGKEMHGQRKWLGEPNYQALVRQYQAKYTEIGGRRKQS